MKTFTRFEEIEAWKEARKVTKSVYDATTSPSFDSDFRLRSQLRSSAVSVMSNIAEGYERGGNKKFVQFLSVAKGSCGELRSQLYVCLDVGYLCEIEHEHLHETTTIVSRKIYKLMRYLRKSDRRGLKYD